MFCLVGTGSCITLTCNYSNACQSKCGVNVFKRKLDNFLSQVPDDPCETNSDNSIAGAALRQSWCLQRDGLKLNSQIRSSKSSKY